MDSNGIRQQFFDFFKSKGHKIVPSAPIVNKEDPSLMFINAGMNQFKEYFLGNSVPVNRRVADTQKCLRVSGKHNDLEEVGRDSYHHTMFEMLGNWSFGDYFKKEAIHWAWELLTEVYALDESRLYVTIFEGDKQDALGIDNEAGDIWKELLPEDRILAFDRKDNFWEMGSTGPCGPCSEIHIDLRSDEERGKVPGHTLVNKDDPSVVELWNLVFIQYERKANGQLIPLPEKHVDTGMGFERLCMAIQGKQSNYDTDVFIPFIQLLEKTTGKTYSGSYDRNANTDIAFRVIVDHIRAISFAISDGQLPGNTGAGYVIRRILRRAVRFGYSFLDRNEPFMYNLVAPLSDYFKEVFPGLLQQRDMITKVIFEEEKSFLKTLELGLKRFAKLQPVDRVISGTHAFELYDTYGFPLDLTKILAHEQQWEVDETAFNQALQEQKQRSRKDAQQEIGDWIVVNESIKNDFVGYDCLELEDAKLLRYRPVVVKKKTVYQVILDKTPFYPEGGGQVGDRGVLLVDGKSYKVLDTKKEHDLIVHYLEQWPIGKYTGVIAARVDEKIRRATERNHSATHMLHAALRNVLGTHVEQKGSLVSNTHLRFDFKHFSKMSSDEIKQVEAMVNDKIRESIVLDESRSLPIEEAQKAGAMMLFGEKYGENVRMIAFDRNYSVELCGGCHVNNTGQIGWFKITNEAAIAAGIRRIEAITGSYAESFINRELKELNEIRASFKNAKNIPEQVTETKNKVKELEKQLKAFKLEKAAGLKTTLLQKVEKAGKFSWLVNFVEDMDSATAKNLIFQIEKNISPAIIVFGLVQNNKPQLMIRISEALTQGGDWHAGEMVRALAKEIQGGGGGQAFYATAGGKNAAGIHRALELAEGMIQK